MASTSHDVALFSNYFLRQMVVEYLHSIGQTDDHNEYMLSLPQDIRVLGMELRKKYGQYCGDDFATLEEMANCELLDAGGDRATPGYGRYYAYCSAPRKGNRPRHVLIEQLNRARLGDDYDTELS